EIDGDREKAANGKGRSDRPRDGTGIGVEREDQAVEHVARCDHSLNLASLAGTTRQKLGRRVGTRLFQLCRNRIEERRCRCAHCPLLMETNGKIYAVKPLGLVSFASRFRLPAVGALVFDWQGRLAGREKLRADGRRAKVRAKTVLGSAPR